MQVLHTLVSQYNAFRHQQLSGLHYINFKVYFCIIKTSGGRGPHLNIGQLKRFLAHIFFFKIGTEWKGATTSFQTFIFWGHTSLHVTRMSHRVGPAFPLCFIFPLFQNIFQIMRKNFQIYHFRLKCLVFIQTISEDFFRH